MKIQEAFTDSVNYVNKFDKEIPQYTLCAQCGSLLLSFEPSVILVFIVDAVEG